MTPQYDIFISYSHRDSPLVQSLYAKLSNAGLCCFLADKDIAAAERWEDRIRDALRTSQRILLLITPNSKDSHWVVAEAGAAWALGKQLVPALAYVEGKELITPIASHQARLVHTPEQIESLVRELSVEGSIAHGNLNGQWRDPTDGDEEVHLTPIEYRLLTTLVRHAGKVLTHQQLLTAVWGPGHGHETHYVRVYMGQLRHKLEHNPARPRYLLTEQGAGYRLLVT